MGFERWQSYFGIYNLWEKVFKNERHCIKIFKGYGFDEPHDVFEVHYLMTTIHVSDETSSIVSCTVVHNCLHLASNICTDICPWTLSVCLRSQFSLCFVLGKLLASRKDYVCGQISVHILCRIEAIVYMNLEIESFSMVRFAL